MLYLGLSAVVFLTALAILIFPGTDYDLRAIPVLALVALIPTGCWMFLGALAHFAARRLARGGEVGR